MRVEDWFWPFVDRHCARHPRADWPELDSEFWEGWKSSFIRNGVSCDVADEASIKLAEKAIRHAGEHLEALLAAVRKVWASSELVASPESREGAEHQSKDCPDCFGSGFAIRFRHQGDDRGKSVTFYCMCPMGRWVEKTHRESDKETRRRIPNLADYPWLQMGVVGWQDEYDNRVRHHPDCWDGLHGRPLLPIGIAGLTAAAKAEDKIRRESYLREMLKRELRTCAPKMAGESEATKVAATTAGEIPF